MLSILKNHPFAVQAFFKRSLVLTFAAPRAELASLIPECLELDIFKDQWAFLAVALVQTSDLRPKGFPKALGTGFFLIGYRLFVTYKTQSGKRLRGLYILRSETDKKRMTFLGNLFTHYQYTTTDIEQYGGGLRSQRSGLTIEIAGSQDKVPLPQGSPFADWKEARRFAGPLPFTFAYNAHNGEVLIIEGVRENWKPTPVAIMAYQFPYIEGLHIRGLQLANAFTIENIPYEWKKGRIELWRQ
jgi:hypothetical protein